MTWKEAWLETVLRELNDGPPPDLTARIMAAGKPQATVHQLPRNGKRQAPWLLVAMGFIGLGVVIATMVQTQGDVVVAQDPKANPTSAAAFVPLQLDARWVYAVVVDDEPRPDVTHTITAVHASQEAAGLAIAQIESSGGMQRHLYLAAGTNLRQYLETGEPGLHTERFAVVLRGPIGAEHEWSWQWRGHIREFMRPGTTRLGRPMAFTSKAKLIDPSANVTVPAGTFEAVMVRATHRGDAGSFVETTWYARGVGVVQRQVSGGPDDQVAVWQLRHYRPGRQRLDPAHALQRLLASDQDLAARGTPDSIEWLNPLLARWLFRSRFATIKWGDDMVFVRVLGTRAVRFDPERPVELTTLLRVERRVANADINVQQTRRSVESRAVADLATAFRASARGWQPMGQFKTLSFRYSAANREGDMQGQLSAVDADDIRHVLACEVEIEADEVTSVVLHVR